MLTYAAWQDANGCRIAVGSYRWVGSRRLLATPRACLLAATWEMVSQMKTSELQGACVQVFARLCPCFATDRGTECGSTAAAELWAEGGMGAMFKGVYGRVGRVAPQMALCLVL